jgi:hypothetical protein
VSIALMYVEVGVEVDAEVLPMIVLAEAIRLEKALTSEMGSYWMTSIVPEAIQAAGAATPP